MKPKSIRLIIVTVLLVMRCRSFAQAAHMDFLVGSTSESGGSLAIAPQPSTPIHVFESLCAAGLCLYSDTNPGFMALPASRPSDGIYTLKSNTTVSLQVVSIDPAVTLKIGDSILRTSGQSATLGSAPTLHIHPSWQLTLPQGQTGSYQVLFKLTTAARGYSASDVYVAVLTNLSDAPSPTATPSITPSSRATSTASPMASPSATTPPEPTATASSTPQPSATETATPTQTLALASPTRTPVIVPCIGDCSADDEVTVDELVLGVNVALGAVSLDSCAALDANDDREVTVDELVSAVRWALDGCPAPSARDWRVSLQSPHNASQGEHNRPTSIRHIAA